MAIEMQVRPVVKEWYGFLAEGKIMGCKCAACGTVEFPPRAVCNTCSSTDWEWVEMSGRGTCQAVTAAPGGCWPYNEDPLITAYVELEEGMNFQGKLKGVRYKQFAELDAALPFPVQAEVIAMSDEVNYVAFRRVEEE